MLKLVHKLKIINASILINVYFSHNLVYVSWWKAKSQFSNGVSEFYWSYLAVTIFIKLIENFLQWLFRTRYQHSEFFNNVAIPLTRRRSLSLNCEFRWRCCTRRNCLKPGWVYALCALNAWQSTVCKSFKMFFELEIV